MKRMALRRRAIAVGLLGAAMPVALAQDRAAIRVWVGFPPGGGTDAIARAIVERLPDVLGQAVIVENRPGAGGRLAVDALLGAPADGTTYMIAPNATPTFQTLVFGSQVRWNILRDFEPVAGLVVYPLGMAVTPNLGAQHAQEFVRWARQNPDKAAFGTPGVGGQNHFLGVQLARVAGIQLPLVAYKGSPPLMTDLLGGHLPSAITLMDQMITQHRAGRVRVIGVFTERRSELMPEIPTFLEQGLDVQLGEAWNAMWAPARTPMAELQRMRMALQRVLSAPATRELLMTRLACVPAYRDGAEMARLQKAELEAWEPIIRASGFKPES